MCPLLCFHEVSDSEICSTPVMLEFMQYVKGSKNGKPLKTFSDIVEQKKRQTSSAHATCGSKARSEQFFREQATAVKVLTWKMRASVRQCQVSLKRQEHRDAIISCAGVGQRRRLFRGLDMLTINWAIGDLPKECRFLFNTQLMFLKKKKGPNLEAVR